MKYFTLWVVFNVSRLSTNGQFGALAIESSLLQNSKVMYEQKGLCVWDFSCADAFALFVVTKVKVDAMSWCCAAALI